ncbi:MAG: leucine-rich repeat domain-containing protein [Acholeplasmatales bacterium]|nr:leucine-rich repeat domain-containing protein [Acholeplasmatales bacterium]
MILSDKERSILQKYRPLLESNPPQIQEFYDNLEMGENLSPIEIGRFIQMFSVQGRQKIKYTLDYFPTGFLARALPLEFITIPSQIQTIGYQCFLQCADLTSVKFESNSICRHIHSKAFDKCVSLAQVILPKNLVSIGSYCFNDCSDLTELHYEGTALGFSTIHLAQDWLEGSKIKKIICSDKELKVNG